MHAANIIFAAGMLTLLISIVLSFLEIQQSTTNTIKVPTSGNVYIVKGGTGSGSIFADDGKKMLWVCNLNAGLQNEIIYLQPGNYKMEFSQ